MPIKSFLACGVSSVRMGPESWHKQLRGWQNEPVQGIVGVHLQHEALLGVQHDCLRRGNAVDGGIKFLHISHESVQAKWRSYRAISRTKETES